ncbi:ChrR family anti-sigma-E factor [Haliangium sp.]|uniref:ChrR family anti-sigma-E factor n=1 Tax=Haliangium sp. TaxID=2663208 RepID=UPI003D0EC9EB
MPRHHASDDMLVAHAAGLLGESESLLVACHLTLCPRCRARVEEAEALGAAVLTELPPAKLPPGTLDAVLARLDEPAPTSAPTPATDPTGLVPGPLFDLVGDLTTARWQRMLPGLELLALPALSDGMHTALVRIAGGGRIPKHRHPGFEGALVLTGGFTDDEGHFERGDLSLRDETKTHEQFVDRPAPCVWLLVADERHIPLTWGGRIARALFGL